MQQPDPAKRQAIMDAAAALFADRPFHEVTLDEVAATARVGKGTLYVYFASKEQLYGTLVVDGFEQLVERVRARIEQDKHSESAWATLEVVVRELVIWARQFPAFFTLMRTADLAAATPQMRHKRRELGKLIEAVIRRGVRNGEFVDPRPQLTAHFVPACVRTAIRYGPANVGREALVRHVLRIIGGGIQRRAS